MSHGVFLREMVTNGHKIAYDFEQRLGVVHVHNSLPVGAPPSIAFAPEMGASRRPCPLPGGRARVDDVRVRGWIVPLAGAAARRTLGATLRGALC